MTRFHLSPQAGPRGALSGRRPYLAQKSCQLSWRSRGPHHGHRWNPAGSAAPLRPSCKSNLRPVSPSHSLTVGSCSSTAFTFPTLDYLGGTDPSLPWKQFTYCQYSKVRARFGFSPFTGCRSQYCPFCISSFEHFLRSFGIFQMKMRTELLANKNFTSWAHLSAQE